MTGLLFAIALLFLYSKRVLANIQGQLVPLWGFDLTYPLGRGMIDIESAMAGFISITFIKRLFLWISFVIALLVLFFLFYPHVASVGAYTNERPNGYTTDTWWSGMGVVANTSAPPPSELPRADVVYSISPLGIKEWPIPGKEDAKALIIYWATAYNINVEKALRITYCESGWNAQAKNRTSSAAG